MSEAELNDSECASLDRALRILALADGPNAIDDLDWPGLRIRSGVAGRVFRFGSRQISLSRRGYLHCGDYDADGTVRFRVVAPNGDVLREEVGTLADTTSEVLEGDRA